MRTRRASLHGPQSVFSCAVCGRRTRAVDSDTCCPESWPGKTTTTTTTGIIPSGNEMKVYESLLARAVERGGDAAAIRRNNPYIWR